MCGHYTYIKEEKEKSNFTTNLTFSLYALCEIVLNLVTDTSTVPVSVPPIYHVLQWDFAFFSYTDL